MFNCLDHKLWKILQHGNARPPYLSPTKTMWVKEQRLELDMEQQTGQNWERSMSRLYMLSPCLLNFYAEYIMQNARLDEAPAGIKIARRNINNL